MRTSIITFFLAAAMVHAQSPQAVSGNSLSFDVASVRPNKSDVPPRSNFPLNAGGMYTANGGLFSASNFPLVTYIIFAYNLLGNEIQFLVPQLPHWVTEDHFDIEARASGNPTKDQMRLMMRSLLLERFKFAVHSESREVPVLAFILAKPGEIGSQLRPHPADTPCQDGPAAQSKENHASDSFFRSVPGGFPPICNGILGVAPSAPGRSRLGGRNVTIQFMADMFSQRISPGRPMVDETGLEGTFDFLLEYVPERPAVGAPDANSPTVDEPTFMEALGDQLGIKTVSRKSRVKVLVVDDIEHPSEN